MLSLAGPDSQLDHRRSAVENQTCTFEYEMVVRRNFSERDQPLSLRAIFRKLVVVPPRSSSLTVRLSAKN